MVGNDYVWRLVLNWTQLNYTEVSLPNHRGERIHIGTFPVRRIVMDVESVGAILVQKTKTASHGLTDETLSNRAEAIFKSGDFVQDSSQFLTGRIERHSFLVSLYRFFALANVKFQAATKLG